MTDVAIECDLRHLFGSARDQGARPTCLAFAASDAHAAVRAGWIALSCEYAYYHALRRDGGEPDDGATLEGMLATIKEDGQPPESEWDYLPSLPANIALWKPPANPQSIYRRNSVRDTGAVATLLERLDSNTPIVLTMCLSDAFYQPDVFGIVAAHEAPDHQRRHAVVAVGHGKRGGDTMILIRNSWGMRWGIDGHAWISEEYLTPRLYALAEMKEDLTDVSASTNTTDMREGVA